MDPEQEQWQRQDEEAHQLEILGVLTRIEMGCGSEVANKAASEMGVSQLWRNHITSERRV